VEVRAGAVSQAAEAMQRVAVPEMPWRITSICFMAALS